MNSGGLSGGIYRPLSSQDIQLLHNRALDLLEEIGMTYESGLDDMLDLVENGGCKVDRDQRRILFPRELVAEMVGRAPAEFYLHSRDGRNDMHLGVDRVHCGTGGTALRIIDLESGETRQTMLEDIYNVARIVDEMAHIHFFQHCCVPHDVPVENYDVNGVFAAMSGTTKHCMIGCNSDAGLRETFDMVSLIAGGAQKLKAEPVFSISSCMIISPLKFCTQSTKNIRQAARLGVPASVTSAPMSGSTSPMTMGGTLLQTHAEVMAGITVHQLTVPGAPALYGGLPAMADMKSMGYQGGAVEVGMMMAAIHQLAKHIGVPNYSSSGLSDAKIPDAQSGWEKAFTTALNVMGGCNYVHHAAGMLESMLCIAYEQYIMDDEIIGQACKMLEGIRLDEGHLAFDAIAQVGPGGHYLTSEHTFEHMRTEYFMGNGVSDKSMRGQWDEKGQKSAWDRAREIAKDILSSAPRSKIDTEIDNQIRSRFPVLLPPGERV
jgi:trimethylamine--corrinoid protein Co-methyltransferase